MHEFCDGLSGSSGHHSVPYAFTIHVAADWLCAYKPAIHPFKTTPGPMTNLSRCLGASCYCQPPQRFSFLASARWATVRGSESGVGMVYVQVRRDLIVAEIVTLPPPAQAKSQNSCMGNRRFNGGIASGPWSILSNKVQIISSVLWSIGQLLRPCSSLWYS